ncbi:hypothetical protein KY362_00980 [Candidatus Woesearchaeota archaeon]|nr:hypothetical protein [Candidatus Woesearchaeota archaeon]
MPANKKKTKKGRYNFLIDSSVYEQFSNICDNLGLIRSKNIENYMKGFNTDGSTPKTRSTSRKGRTAKGRYNFLIDGKVYAEFARICDNRGLIRSKNIENYMREFIEKNK